AYGFVNANSGGSGMNFDGYVENMVISGSYPFAAVTATGVSSGEHDIEVSANVTHLRIYVDSVLKDSALLSGTSIPDNDNDIVSFQNNVMPYVEYQEITIDGVPQQDIKWEYGSTFHNSAHGGDDATPTFRTASSDADLSAAIISQEGLVTASTPAISFGDAYTPNWGADAPAGLYTEGDDSYGIGGINIGELVTAAADDAGQDATSWHIILAFTLAIGALVLVYGLTHSSKLGQRGSLILSLLASGGVLVYFYSQGTIAGWVLIPFGLMALLLAMWRKSPSPVD
ncbi:hypothetical protein KKE60_07035, partial [Patescibacteria group bacterium]|nr:hypothetical protein [Patescibacteria group bacterium]